MPNMIEAPVRHVTFIGRVRERIGPHTMATWLEVRYALPWWPDEPISSWMVPGTYDTYREEG